MVYSGVPAGVVIGAVPVVEMPAVVAADTKAPAKLTLTLPAEAKLTIDGHETKSTSATRVFITPPLENGKSYTYTLKATVPVGSRTEVITKDVTVVAGQDTKATLTLPAAAVAAAAGN